MPMPGSRLAFHHRQTATSGLRDGATGCMKVWSAAQGGRGRAAGQQRSRDWQRPRGARRSRAGSRAAGPRMLPPAQRLPRHPYPHAGATGCAGPPWRTSAAGLACQGLQRTAGRGGRQGRWAGQEGRPWDPPAQQMPSQPEPAIPPTSRPPCHVVPCAMRSTSSSRLLEFTCCSCRDLAVDALRSENVALRARPRPPLCVTSTSSVRPAAPGAAPFCAPFAAPALLPVCWSAMLEERGGGRGGAMERQMVGGGEVQGAAAVQRGRTAAAAAATAVGGWGEGCSNGIVHLGPVL